MVRCHRQCGWGRRLSVLRASRRGGRGARGGSGRAGCDCFVPTARSAGGVRFPGPWRRSSGAGGGSGLCGVFEGRPPLPPAHCRPLGALKGLLPVSLAPWAGSTGGRRRSRERPCAPPPPRLGRRSCPQLQWRERGSRLSVLPDSDPAITECRRRQVVASRMAFLTLPAEWLSRRLGQPEASAHTPPSTGGPWDTSLLGHDDTQPPVGFPLSGGSPRLIAVTGFWILASRSHPPPLPRDLAHCGVAPGSRGNSCGSLAGRPAGRSLEPESSGSFRAGVYREPETERHFGRSTVLSPLKNQSILVSVDL